MEGMPLFAGVSSSQYRCPISRLGAQRKCLREGSRCALAFIVRARLLLLCCVSCAAFDSGSSASLTACSYSYVLLTLYFLGDALPLSWAHQYPRASHRATPFLVLFRF